MRYADRSGAGRRLAEALGPWTDESSLVLALPRGGVPVGFEVARALKIPLAALPARKLGAPGRPEFAVGALAGYESPAVALDDEALQSLGVSPDYVAEEIARQRARLAESVARFAPPGERPVLRDRQIILVDDGVATGATLRAALTFLEGQGAPPVVLALPVGPRDTLRKLRPLVRALLCPWIPEPFYAVGDHYENFDPVPDAEAVALLRSGATPGPVPAPGVLHPVRR